MIEKEMRLSKVFSEVIHPGEYVSIGVRKMSDFRARAGRERDTDTHSTRTATAAVNTYQ